MTAASRTVRVKGPGAKTWEEVPLQAFGEDRWWHPSDDAGAAAELGALLPAVLLARFL